MAFFSNFIKKAFRWPEHEETPAAKRPRTEQVATQALQRAPDGPAAATPAGQPANAGGAHPRLAAAPLPAAPSPLGQATIMSAARPTHKYTSSRWAPAARPAASGCSPAGSGGGSVWTGTPRTVLRARLAPPAAMGAVAADSSLGLQRPPGQLFLQGQLSVTPMPSYGVHPPRSVLSAAPSSAKARPSLAAQHAALEAVPTQLAEVPAMPATAEPADAHAAAAAAAAAQQPAVRRPHAAAPQQQPPAQHQMPSALRDAELRAQQCLAQQAHRVPSLRLLASMAGEDEEGDEMLLAPPAGIRPPLEEAAHQRAGYTSAVFEKAIQSLDAVTAIVRQPHTAAERGVAAAIGGAQRSMSAAELLREQLEAMQLARHEKERAREAAVEERQRAQHAAAARPEESAEEVIELLSDEEQEGEAEQEAAEVSGRLARLRSEEGEEVEEAVLGSVPHWLPKRYHAQYAAALAKGDPHELLVEDPVSHVPVTRAKMAAMAPLQWLNDELMNIYVSLLLQRDARRRQQGVGGPRCHFFNTFFAAKLYKEAAGYAYKNVLRWTRPGRLKSSGQASACVLDCDRLVAPVHQNGSHWVCAVVDLAQRQLIYYDSLRGEDPACLDALARYVRDEYADKKGEQREDVLKWPRLYPKDIPHQANGCDCGVFTLLFAEHAGRGAPMKFSQADIANARIKMAHDILRLCID